MKAGKEEMVGLLAAVRWYLAQDHAAIAAGWERTVQEWVDRLDALPGVFARRDALGEAGQPVRRALVTLDPALGLTAAAVREALLAGSPPIEVATEGERSFYLNPEWLEPGEEVLVAERVEAVVQIGADQVGSGKKRSPTRARKPGSRGDSSESSSRRAAARRSTPGSEGLRR
jgi:L-seryl-tRNA(Ser) seleniumtransferase